ncbi:hypothetical protein DXA14_25405 [Hungatella hathewayi]|uniref:Uncharacterized protein n=1 Tax=Hungatella hathewayi TaxID=154046 RepID=A0A3E4UC61_9FIRM|nr:hypothetical protein [Hungatella hathewayi]MUB62876.1 hypothetical protein [Hungatella hathewayi]RGD71378.1 hypothetical protein DWX31_07275 [Hungatella hathewayi]RGK93666.1 hypothetical protein DXC88_18965 [Hungatella hathewayi]RGM06272.1 hypothetical protein DXC39_08915 [Hungatella hathewayi]
MKVARTVWSGGKSEDNFKGLPIAIKDTGFSPSWWNHCIYYIEVYPGQEKFFDPKLHRAACRVDWSDPSAEKCILSSCRNDSDDGYFVFTETGTGDCSG